jgi:hypothetical protein
MNRRTGTADRIAIAGGIALAGLAVCACSTYRVEYHKRPGYYSAVGGRQADEVTLDDGTVLVFKTRQATEGLSSHGGGSGERFQIREEREDGTIVLRALLPQHVLANTLTCLRNQEYDLIWEQLLAERTRRAYELRDEGFEEFEAFCSSQRNELAATLTRMLLGLARGEAYMENVGGGIVRFRLHPRVASEFRFKTAEVIGEGGGLRLLIIR